MRPLFIQSDQLLGAFRMLGEGRGSAPPRGEWENASRLEVALAYICAWRAERRLDAFAGDSARLPPRPPRR
jgi:hypothetical protein